MQRWLFFLVILLGFYNILPFAAPAAMRLGWTGVGAAIYDLYATQCHQMAQRSFFLFGEQLMYPLDDLPVEVSNMGFKDTVALRSYRGDEAYGWKVAWSDRMVYMYGTLWLASIVYWLVSRRRAVRLLPLWTILLFVLPMAVDGTTHLLSDVSGLSVGFRYDNEWLASLTGNAFPDTFYAGDALGSFNSYARMLSGVLFGLGVVWVLFPRVDQEVRRTVAILDRKLARYQHHIESVKAIPVILEQTTR
jgi:uncharacterized membrane protein